MHAFGLIVLWLALGAAFTTLRRDRSPNHLYLNGCRTRVAGFPWKFWTVASVAAFSAAWIWVMP